MFDCVSVLFSDVVTFTEICSRITPMEVVSMLNAMYSIFDTLTERNGVYKVETIGDAYMVVSGAPEKEPNHAEKVCDMALDMVDAIQDLKDPSTASHLQLSLDLSFVMRINMSYVWPIERLCVINCPSSGLRVLKVLRDEMFIP
uniref:Uncharacterized protein n=1 Tax=Phlebotomus papatasi TaxID=29031 RepID=A0A1B0GMY5_PHLPP